MLEGFFWFGLGLIFGSFTNVLILRHDTQELTGRSMCPACGRTLRWFELIPVVSWLLLRARCRTCHAPIAIQYPLVELLVSCGFLGVWLSGVPLFVTILGCAAVVLLVAITVYDLYYTLIPDAWSYAFAAVAFALGWLTLIPQTSIDTVLFLAAGPVVAAPLAGLWFVSRGTWMGLGDAKLALGIGWLLGLTGGYVALCLAFVIGAVVGVFILIPMKYVSERLRTYGITRFQTPQEGFTMKSEVPFGPFLILSLCIVWFSSLYGIPLVMILSEHLLLLS